MAKIFLIDAYSQIYRVFYAIRQLTNARGEPANALYGMARLFLQLDELQPSDYGAIVYDLGKCVRRTGLLPEYKAQRPPMPEELRSQTAAIREWAGAFGWNIIDRQGFEADDLIAGITAQRGTNAVTILTGDKDLFQLLAAPEVRILLHGKDKTPWLEADATTAREKFGVAPSQIRDYLALLGDTADNIPGVPGCGPKTAAKLLADYGSIDNLLAHLDELKSAKLRETLAAEAENLRRNQSLVRLDEALPENWSGLEGLRRRTPDWEKLLQLCDEQGFKSIAEAIRKRRQPVQQTFGF